MLKIYSGGILTSRVSGHPIFVDHENQSNFRGEFAGIWEGSAKTKGVCLSSCLPDKIYELRTPLAWMTGWILNPPSPADWFPTSCIATCLVLHGKGFTFPAEAINFGACWFVVKTGSRSKQRWMIKIISLNRLLPSHFKEEYVIYPFYIHIPNTPMKLLKPYFYFSTTILSSKSPPNIVIMFMDDMFMLILVNKGKFTPPHTWTGW